MSSLEERFHQAMIDSYKLALQDCKYNAKYFLDMVTDYGGVAAARRLLATDTPSEGFATLWLCKRLDLTVEAHVIKPAFQPLFTLDEIAIARSRLKDYGYKFDA